MAVSKPSPEQPNELPNNYSNTYFGAKTDHLSVASKHQTSRPIAPAGAPTRRIYDPNLNPAAPALAAFKFQHVRKLSFVKFDGIHYGKTPAQAHYQLLNSFILQ